MNRFVGILCLGTAATIAFAQGDGASVSVGTDAAPAYSPATASDRLHWVVRGTLGVPNLAATMFTSAEGTWSNSPKEYGTHWDGFGKRYGLRLANGATGRTIEAGLGSLWGEDPRYFRTTGQPMRSRLTHVLKFTVMSTNRNGDPMPAYARFMAIPANSFLSNQWRPDSEADTAHALRRIPLSFVDRLIGNAFAEFWPDIKKHVFRSKNP